MPDDICTSFELPFQDVPPEYRELCLSMGNYCWNCPHRISKEEYEEEFHE